MMWGLVPVRVLQPVMLRRHTGWSGQAQGPTSTPHSPLSLRLREKSHIWASSSQVFSNLGVVTSEAMNIRQY